MAKLLKALPVEPRDCGPLDEANFHRWWREFDAVPTAMLRARPVCLRCGRHAGLERLLAGYLFGLLATGRWAGNMRVVRIGLIPRIDRAAFERRAVAHGFGTLTSLFHPPGKPASDGTSLMAVGRPTSGSRHCSAIQNGPSICRTNSLRIVRTRFQGCLEFRDAVLFGENQLCLAPPKDRVPSRRSAKKGTRILTRRAGVLRGALARRVYPQDTCMMARTGTKISVRTFIAVDQRREFCPTAVDCFASSERGPAGQCS